MARQRITVLHILRVVAMRSAQKSIEGDEMTIDYWVWPLLCYMFMGAVGLLVGLVIGWLFWMPGSPDPQRETGPLAVDWDEVLQEVQER